MVVKEGRARLAISMWAKWARLLMARPWLLSATMGGVTGLYVWQFLSTNQDFTGPQDISLPTGLALTFLIGPLTVLGIQILSALVLAWLGRQPFMICLRQDALSLSPLGLLGLSPLMALLTGWHSTAHHAGVIVLVSLAFSGCLALKASAAWQIRQIGRQRLGLDDRTARYILVGVIIAYALVFATLQVLRYDAYQLWGVDHSRVTQALWNTLHGRFLRFTFVGGIDLNLLADHFEPIFLLLVPLYWVWPDPRLPLIVQAAVLSLAAWPLYHITLRRLKSPALALGWALTYLVLPITITAVQDSAGAIRTDALAIPIFMLMWEALDRRNWTAFVTVVLAFASKQYLSLLVAMLGLYIAIRQRRWKLGLGLFAVGVLWFVALVQWVMPAIHSGPNISLSVLYGPAVGETGIAGIVQLLLHEPGQLLAPLFSYDQFLFVFFWLFSFGGLPLLDPLLAAVGLPIFVSVGMSTSRPQDAVRLGDHHYYSTLPFFLVAALNGLTALRSWAERHIRVNVRCTGVVLTAFALGMGLTAGFFWASGPLSWRFWDRRSGVTYWGNRYAVSEHARLADGFVRMVPPEIPVLASDYLLAHLANRPQVYHFFWAPDDVLERVDYVVADLLQNRVGLKVSTAPTETRLLDELLSRPDFALTAYEDGLLFFQRDGTDGYVSRVEMLAESPQPKVCLERDLGGRLRLLGYDPPAALLRAGERCRVTYYWQVLDGFAAPFDVKLDINPESVETHRTDYVLADRFAGAAGEFSVLHLPTYIQMPPETWQPGQVIRETYDFRLPADARGEYDWSVGLYAVPRFLGIRVNSERQVPGAEPVTLGTLSVQP